MLWDNYLSKALELADYKALRREQKLLRQRGELMGIGVTTTTQFCGFGPAKDALGLGGYESATVRLDPMGKVTVLTGASPHGQGEETSFAQLVADDLGIPMDDIEVIHGDTALIPRGIGTFGSRSLVVGGSAVLQACQQVKDKARLIAGALLRVDPQHVTVQGGSFVVEDIPGRSASWADVAGEAYDGRKLPADVERGLEATAFWEPPGLTFPFCAHVAAVRIDKATGEVRLTQYVSVDDCGTVVNPMLVEGQVHGGLAIGIGQALMEEAVYDDGGQLVTGSFADYGIPRAEDVPSFTLGCTVTPTNRNPMGAKGIGELATTASPATIVNAVVDALSDLGVTHVDMPVTAEKVWRILREKSGRK